MAPTLTVLGKELRELLRDVHVLTLSVGFPFLFYPLLVWGMFQVQLLQEGLDERSPPRVVVSGPSALVDVLRAPPVELVEGDVADPGPLERGEVDALVHGVVDGQAWTVTLSYRSTEPRSRRAFEVVGERLKELEDQRLDALAAARSLRPEDVRPWEIVEENLAPPDRMLTFVLSRILPGMLIAVMLMAALYPAVEVVVGERERGCLETSLVTAPDRLPLLLGKTGAVVVLTLAAVLGNLGAMSLTVLHMVAMRGKGLDGEVDLSLGGILLALPPLLCASLLASAFMIVAALPARSFKEGQNLGSVAMLVGLGLAGYGFTDGAELNLLTALLPLANAALVARDAFLGELTPLPWLVTVVELLGLTALLGLAARRVVDDEAWLLDGALPRWLGFVERMRDRR